MLDAKFVCTISALVAALVAVCSFNSNQKMEIIEGYGNANTGFGAWQGSSQFSVYKDPASVINQVNGEQVVSNEQLKNGMFYSTVGLQPQLAPRATATSIYGALKNQSQAQTQQAANGPNGAIPPMQGSVEPTNVQSAILNTGSANGREVGLVQSSTAFNDEQSTTMAGAAGTSNFGDAVYSMSKSSENYQPNIENFIVPGDKNKSCAGGCSRGPEFMADPVMNSNYTNGNFETVNESLLRPTAITDIPIGTMRSLTAAGDDVNVLQLNRLIYANTKSRNRGDACLLRGDIVPQTTLSRDQGSMFVPSQAFRGVEPLGMGALAAMGGAGVQGSSLGDLIGAQVSQRATNTAAGGAYTTKYLNELIGSESTLAIQTGLQENASVSDQAGASIALAAGGNSFGVNQGMAS